MEVILEKLANFPIGTLYGYCMDFWVEIDYFPKMEIVQVFQTWIFSSYQFGFLRYRTWIFKIWVRTSYLEINKTLKLRDPGSSPERAWIFFQVLFQLLILVVFLAGRIS